MTLKEKLKDVSEKLRIESNEYPKMKTLDVCDMLNYLLHTYCDDEKISDEFALKLIIDNE